MPRYYQPPLTRTAVHKLVQLPERAEWKAITPTGFTQRKGHLKIRNNKTSKINNNKENHRNWDHTIFLPLNLHFTFFPSLFSPLFFSSLCNLRDLFLRHVQSAVVVSLSTHFSALFLLTRIMLNEHNLY